MIPATLSLRPTMCPGIRRRQAPGTAERRWSTWDHKGSAVTGIHMGDRCGHDGSAIPFQYLGSKTQDIVLVSRPTDCAHEDEYGRPESCEDSRDHKTRTLGTLEAKAEGDGSARCKEGA